ncbi:GAF domain-containing SpoIIE family protein phosphatase [Luteimicrobium subarcticum]|uniref:Serine phosphatase RsbU (Regulator of sigma subunit) n=1 Tax=Luteimicrobium subarcticum TaxID=620910 RepID=A0A2M8W1Q9_9MICO|nr:SpoIIE family protein phosphatase [Luteimicrobium subarcticum]PJI84872.1 serine phosphatase RsbU (regulator of sigma subunit) [Luteimicrobium subarcticum]
MQPPPEPAADGPVGSEDPAYQRFARLAHALLGVPVSLVSFVDASGQVFPGMVGLPEPWATRRGTALSHSFCQYVVRADEPLVVSDARTVDFLQDNLAIPDLGAIAYAGYPLHDARGRAVGSLCAIDSEPRTWTDDELATLADLAAACTSEIQVRGERTRSLEAERLARRSSRLNRDLLIVAEAFAETRTLPEALDTLQRMATTALGGSRCAVALIEDRSITWARRSPVPGLAEVAWRDIPLTETTNATVRTLQAGRPLLFADGDELAEMFPELRGTGPGAAAMLPLVTAAAPLGVAVVRWQLPREIDDATRTVARQLAAYATLALERALLLQDRRDVAHQLQAAMLTELPTIDGVQLDAAYVPASRGEEVGGDWYDALALADGSSAFVVGDVTGHDMESAARMGQLRAMLRGFTWTFREPPSRVLTRLDEANRGLRLGTTATALVCHVSTPRRNGRRELLWSSAGHLPPVVRRADGSVETLHRRGDMLLGIAPADRHDHRAWLRPGDTLVLYTDGLVERRDETVLDGVERLRALIAATGDTSPAALVAALAPDDARRDDVAVVTVTVTVGD